MTDQDEFAEELKSIFLDELDDVLDEIETAFLRFEKTPNDRDILHEIFRYFHNIKGSSKTVGFSDLSHFAHNAENMLAKLREGELKISDDIVDVLLDSSDVLRDYSEKLRDGRQDVDRLSAQAEKIGAILDGAIEEPGDVGEGLDASNDASEHSDEEDFGPSDDELDLVHRRESEHLALEETTTHVAETNSEPAGFGIFDDDDKEPDLPLVRANPKVVALKASEPRQSVSFDKEAPSTVASAPDHESSGEAQKRQKEEFIKVPMSKINQILDLFGEQVILQSALDHALESEVRDMEYIEKSVSQLKKITHDLRYTMVTLRMISLDTLFNRMERTVRDTARLTGKKVNFEKIGQDLELDKSIVDALIDPLTHMVRNAVDHGLEDQIDRERSTKENSGTVTLAANRVGGAFEIVVRDDGKGIDPQVIFSKAVAKGLAKPDVELSNHQIFDFLFVGGFSTKDQATEISGRGVGMDVVRQKIRSLKGTCSVNSELGRGTSFNLKLPLSLAMFNGTVIIVNDQRYVVPNSDFIEALNLEGDLERSETSGQEIVSFGERILRVINLRQCLNIGREREVGREDKHLAIVAQYEDEQFALIVDDILSQEQIVLKELGPEAKQIRGASGGTILGDGRVALVLDLSAIIKRDRMVARKQAI